MKRTNLPKAVKDKITHFTDEDLKDLDIEQLQRLRSQLINQHDVTINFINKYIEKLMYQNPLDAIKSNYFFYCINNNQERYQLVEILSVDSEKRTITMSSYEYHLNIHLQLTLFKFTKTIEMNWLTFYLTFNMGYTQPYSQEQFERHKRNITTRIQSL